MFVDLPKIDPKNILQTGAVAVLTTLIGLLVEFVKGKIPAARKDKAYDDATKHLSYLEKWVQISERATPDLSPEIRSQVSTELQKVHQRLAVELEVVHVATGAANPIVTSQTRPVWRRLVLFYKPRRAVAWLPRIFFYFTAFMTCLGVIVGLTSGDVRRDSSYWLGYAVILFFTFIFWLLSKAAD